MRRFNFAWINICFMVVLGALIFINRSTGFIEARSWPGYLIYALFILTGLLAITGLVLSILNYYKAKKGPAESEKDRTEAP